MQCHASRIVSGLLALAVTLTTVAPVSAIVNGEPDDGQEPMFANVGAMVAIAQPPNFPVDVPVPQAFCSGTLIHPRIFLTAGHCAEFAANIGLGFDDMRVTFSPDAHLYPDDPASYEIDTIIPHPDYVTQPYGAAAEHFVDVAVVILKDPVEGVTPVTLPPDDLDLPFLDQRRLTGALGYGPGGGTPLLIAGYGYVFEFPPPRTEFLVFPQGFRNWALTEFRALRNPYLMTNETTPQGNGGASEGDSGGPIFWIGEGGLVQVGLNSSGDHVDASLGVFARIDLPEVLTFLHEKIAAFE